MAFNHLDVRCLFTILICTSFSCISSSDVEMTVNPPQDFEIVDPGYLGYLHLQWKPPLFLDNFKDCIVEYELKYRNLGSKNWKTIITMKLYYKTGFDLNKGAEAKTRTLLSQQCTNGSEVQSSWSEATYRTLSQGNVETKIQDMTCIYYNWQYLFCSWERGTHVPLDTSYNLFYWYEGLDRAAQCPEYTKVNGKNNGCKFPYMNSSDYKDFYICVNGSSQNMLIRSSYFVFQLQNIVKPLPPDYLSITIKDSSEINLKWNLPRGPIPSRCFIYEILLTEDDASWVSTTVENEMYTVKTSNKSQRICFIVRSKVNIYCSDDGLWSEWSDEQCWEGNDWKETLMYFMLPFALILLSIFVITLRLLHRQTLLKMIFDPTKQEFMEEETLC